MLVKYMFSKLRLLLISFLVYFVVNIFESLIHYNIGRYSDSELRFDVPTKKDWIKIIFVIFFFAFLQGILTCIFD